MSQNAGKVLLTSAVFFLLIAHRSLLIASFEDSPVGGRGAGVDGAMTAMADDVYALYDNPAGIAFLSKPELGAHFGRLYGGLTDNSNLSRSFLGYVQPHHGEAIGVSYNALDLAGLYKEETFGVSYAFKMSEDFSLGVTGTHYRKSVGHDFNTDNAELNGIAQAGVSDPVFLNGHTADTWGGDAGALCLVFLQQHTNRMTVWLGEPAQRA